MKDRGIAALAIGMLAVTMPAFAEAPDHEAIGPGVRSFS